jgi:nucleotide-binding universal stress UspA family protein
LADEQGAKFQVLSLPFYESSQEVDGYRAFKSHLGKLVSEEAAKELSPVVLSEPPSESLAELAVAREADLIVFDQRGRFLNPHLGGCQLTDVLAMAPCPVLAIPFVK